MSLKHQLMPIVANLITSERLHHLRYLLEECRRKLKRQPHQATFYFRLDDPYSLLMAQVLPRFAKHFGITLTPKVMLYLDHSMYPDADMLAALAPKDAAPLAQLHDLVFRTNGHLPEQDITFEATRCLLLHEHDERFWSLAAALGEALWQHDHERLQTLVSEHRQMPADQAQLALEARRDQFLQEGHYLTGTVHYGGEWYWSLERLDHLAQRLTRLGLGNGAAPLAYGRAKTASLSAPPAALKGKPLTLFFSFRSPYSYIALARTYALADHYGLDLRIRPVLPMVMRGLAVPKAKRFYILQDAAREARLHQVPFGKVCDPVGLGVERCMAIWPFAEKEGKLREWLRSAATGIWSEGVNAASEKGLQTLVTRAGLDWQRARRWLDDNDWRQQAEENRNAMMAAGSWGVPTFMTETTTLWGQDRFALVEQSLLDSVAHSPQTATEPTS